MEPIRFLIVLTLIGATACLGDDQAAPASDAEKPLPASYTEKVSSTPDFCQNDQRFGPFEGNGAMNCVPAALSDSLVWLNGHGFPKLLNKQSFSLADQANLIRRLCKDDLLATNPQTGTNHLNLIQGIEKLFKDSGYECKIENVHCEGSLRSKRKLPDEDWMLRSCIGTSNVLLHIGWFKSEKTSFQFVDGHTVALIGFKEERGKRVVLIHDPAGRSGVAKKTEPCRLIPLPAEYTIGLKSGKSIKAEGCFKLDGIRVKEGRDLAIIVGATAFTPIEKQE